MQFPFRDDSVLPTTDARRDYHVGDRRLPWFTREFDHSLTIRISECFSSLISPGRRTRERANVLEAEQSSRKLRLICLASAVMSGYLRVHELLEDELQNPLDPSAEEAAHDEELFDFAFGHNHMLLMAQFVLILSAAKPYFTPGRTYSVRPEVYSFARIERACNKWPQSVCKTRGARR